MRNWLRKNWFVPALFGVVALAWIFPEPASPGGALRPQFTTKAGVVLIFFLQGVSLPLNALRAGLLQWRLHLFVQLFVFLLIPLLVLGMAALGGAFLPADLHLGFLFLAVLPTTISTSVIFTAMAQGNAAGAIFNSTFSNVAGVVLTPLWMSALAGAGAGTRPLDQMLLEISLLLLVPLAVGQLARPILRGWADAHRSLISSANGAVILFIIFAAFSSSVTSGVWREHGAAVAFWALGGSLLLFGVATALTAGGVRLLGFGRADAVAALFCAPQKTLAAGAPMAKLIFAANPALGLILLPLMVYHLLQLFLGGFLIGWLNRRFPVAAGAASAGRSD